VQVASPPNQTLRPRPGSGPVGTVAPAIARAADGATAGLAAIVAGRTVPEVYRAVCTLARRFPRVAGASILRQDDRGLFATAFHAADAPVSSADLAVAASALHHHWLAAHAPGSPAHPPAFFAPPGHHDLAIVPFVRENALLGALVVSGKNGRPPLDLAAERVTAGALGLVAAQALDAIVFRQRLEAAISRAELEAELLSARRSLGRELHDGPTQDLALAGLTLDRLVATLGEDQATSADARQARDLIDRSVIGMRHAITKLRTTAKPAPSITGPLRDLLAEIGPAGPGFEVDFGDASGVRLAPEVERAMIGIVREALHNVRKHARADSVRLEVKRGAGEVEIAVIDDGVGIAGDAPPGHFGLEQIRELAAETGGRIEIGSHAGQGTAVRAWIPLPPPTVVPGRPGPDGNAPAPPAPIPERPPR